MTEMIQPVLTYESLEKLRVRRPVDRLAWISHACAGKTVLDIGCYDETALAKRGTPHWLHGRILETADRVIGIDISQDIPDEGIESGKNGRILRRDAVKLELREINADEFDSVVAGEFIEHIECPSDFLRSIKRRFDGRELIISTPNGICFANTLLGLLGREVQHQDHLHNFTYKTLNTLCLRAGFSEWEIIPYRFYATEMILASQGVRKALVKSVQAFIRLVERLFPLLSFGYIVRIKI